VTKSPESNSANEAARKWALLEELRRQGITDGRVIEAMSRVPRAFFLDSELAAEAWRNVALAIPHQQTISQPFVVALMTQSLALDGSERVLEVGTGSGYQAAVLSELAREVITIERIPALAAAAIARFDALALRNIVSIVGDGSDGWAPGAPYDAIMVTAGARQEPAELLAQLSPEHGRMVIPIGPSDDERLTLFHMSQGELSRQDLGSVRFVPLIRDHIQEQES
jgi:protein-L-isoaspartate(D-aspartate) O-methyltransferase